MCTVVYSGVKQYTFGRNNSYILHYLAQNMVNVVVKNLNKPANNNFPSKLLHPTCYNTRKYVINVSYCFSSLSDILSLTKKEIDVWGKKKLKEEIDKYNDLRIRAKSHDNRRELADKLWNSYV